MRIAIAATGALLLALGGTALARGLGGASGPLLDPALARFAGDRSWFFPVAAGAAALPAFAGPLWLVHQIRTLVHRRWPDLDRDGRALERAAAEALAREARTLPGVLAVRVRLTGTAHRPRLLLHVSCTGDAIVGEVYGELGAGPVERYRRAVGMPDLPVVIRFRPVPVRPRRRLPEPETA